MRYSEQDHIFHEVASELGKARALFAPFNSGHEGYAVILEEVQELWDEIRLKTGTREGQRREALQVAAMAIRYITDVTDKPQLCAAA